MLLPFHAIECSVSDNWILFTVICWDNILPLMMPLLIDDAAFRHCRWHAAAMPHWWCRFYLAITMTLILLIFAITLMSCLFIDAIIDLLIIAISQIESYWWADCLFTPLLYFNMLFLLILRHFLFDTLSPADFWCHWLSLPPLRWVDAIAMLFTDWYLAGQLGCLMISWVISSAPPSFSAFRGLRCYAILFLLLYLLSSFIFSFDAAFHYCLLASDYADYATPELMAYSFRHLRFHYVSLPLRHLRLRRCHYAILPPLMISSIYHFLPFSIFSSQRALLPPLLPATPHYALLRLFSRYYCCQPLFALLFAITLCHPFTSLDDIYADCRISLPLYSIFTAISMRAGHYCFVDIIMLMPLRLILLTLIRCQIRLACHWWAAISCHRHYAFFATIFTPFIPAR